MWSAIRWLLLRIAAIRWVFKLGWLGLLIPLAFLLKSIGLPVLLVLVVLALPILILLFVFGLPIFLVFVAGSAFMGLVGMVLSLSFAVLKIALFVVLPIWLLFALWSWIRGPKGNGGDKGDSTVKNPPPPPPEAANDFDPT